MACVSSVPRPVRISKGVIMPTFPFCLAAYARARRGQRPSAPIRRQACGCLSRLAASRWPLTYHSDLRLPKGLVQPAGRPR